MNREDFNSKRDAFDIDQDLYQKVSEAISELARSQAALQTLMKPYHDRIEDKIFDAAGNIFQLTPLNFVKDIGGKDVFVDIDSNLGTVQFEVMKSINHKVTVVLSDKEVMTKDRDFIRQKIHDKINNRINNFEVGDRVKPDMTSEIGTRKSRESLRGFIRSIDSDDFAMVCWDDSKTHDDARWALKWLLHE